jgi:hypothetical protein
MVPAQYISFLLASAGASAALIGLLFVAVSVDPERVFGRQAVAQRQAEALSAFTALVNVFFISLGGLDPGLNIGTLAVIMGILALSQTLALLRLWPRWQHDRQVVRGLILFIASAAVYGYQIWTAQHLIGTPRDISALNSLLGLLLGAYAIGLVRAWELLGAPSGLGLSAMMGTALGSRRAAQRSASRAPAADDTEKDAASADESVHSAHQGD